RPLDHHRGPRKGADAKQVVDRIVDRDAEALGLVQPGRAAGELDDAAAGLVALRARPGGEAEELREALGDRGGENGPAGASAGGDRPLRTERVQGLADGAARGAVRPRELVLGGQLEARDEVLVEDLTAQLVGDVAVERAACHAKLTIHVPP